MLMSVSTNPLPLLGITHPLALYRSYPAAKALPLVGVVACAESFFTSSGGELERGGGGAAMFAGAFWMEEEDMAVLGRLGKGDVCKEGDSCDSGGGVGTVNEKRSWGDALTRKALSEFHYYRVPYVQNTFYSFPNLNPISRYPTPMTAPHHSIRSRF